MAKIEFIPAEGFEVYRGKLPDGSMLILSEAGIYEVPDAKAVQLLADYPQYFTGIRDPGGDVKATAAPSMNKAAAKPERNK